MSAYRKLFEINTYTTVEDELRYVISHVRVSGIGVVVDAEVRDIVRLSRKFEKKGKIFWFTNTQVDELKPYRDKVMFLVYEVKLGREEISLPKHIGILYAEFQKHPKNLKLRFPAWQVVKGSIRVGRSKYDLKGVMRVPTYDRYSVLFITHPEDIVREYTKYEPGIGKTLIKEFLLQNIIDKYRYNPARNKIVTTQHLTTPLFTPR